MKNSFVNYEIASNYKESSSDAHYVGIYNLFKEVYTPSKEEHLTSQERGSTYFSRQKRRKWKR